MRLWNWRKDDGSGLPKKVVFGDLERPTITICPSQPSPAGDRFAIPDTAKAALGDLTMHATKTWGEVAVGTSQTYTLVFSAKVQRGLAEGNYSLMESLRDGSRAIAVDGSGKIIEHASIRLSGAVNPATLALAAWQVLSIVVARKHLGDINARLARLDAGIRDVLERMNTGRRTWIGSNFDYLRRVETVHQGGQFSPAEVPTLNNQFETIEREFSRVMLALEAEMDRQLEEFTRLNVRGRKVKQSVALAKEQISEFDSRVQQYLLALYVRLVAAKLKHSLPADHALARLRVEELAGKLGAQRQRQERFLTILTSQVPELGESVRKWCRFIEGSPSQEKSDDLVEGNLTLQGIKGVAGVAASIAVAGLVPGLVRLGSDRAKQGVDSARHDLDEQVRLAFSTFNERSAHLQELVSQTRQAVARGSEETEQPLALEVTLEGGARVTNLRRVPLPVGSQA